MTKIKANSTETEHFDPGAVLSAFAVYNNKVKGVSSYTEAVNGPGQGKKKKNKKLKATAAKATKNTATGGTSPVLAGVGEGKKKNKNKKLKTNETATATQTNAVTDNSSVAAEVADAKRIKNAEKNLKKRLKKKEIRKAKRASLNGEAEAQVNVQSPSQSPPKKKQKPETEVPKSKSPKKKPSEEVSENPSSSPACCDGEHEHSHVEVGKQQSKKSKQSKLHKNQDSENGSKTNTQTATLEDGERPSLSKLLTSLPVNNSPAYGLDLFKWLIAPHSVPEFFSKVWEKSPIHIRRPGAKYYHSWLVSSGKLDEILRKNVIKFGTNVDVTSYTNGKRETHNPEGRAHPAVVWDYYANGCSVRWSNPQAFVKPIWRLSAALQEYLGTFVGSNIYLTPGGTQGFAPHYDDIEAFVLQVEGKKHWKVYAPRSEEEVLPSVSSPNFDESDIGEPILDVVLEEGDLLYFPRGFIHQAKAVEGVHSLHITLSAYQNNTMTDLIREYLPEALDVSFRSDQAFRSGLPTDFLSYMGVTHADTTDPVKLKKRAAFMKRVTNLTTKILTHSWDTAADRLGKKFIWDSLPPYLTTAEKQNTVYEDGEYLVNGRVMNRTELVPDSEIKLIRKNCIRILLEEGALRVYYNSENSLEYHGEEARYLEIPDEAGAGIDMLIESYPKFVKIEDLPIPDHEGAKFQLIGDLWEKGLLITREPLEPIALDEDADAESVEEEESEHESDREFIDDDDDESSLDGDSLISNPEAEQSEDENLVSDSDMEEEYTDDDESVVEGENGVVIDSEEDEPANNGVHVNGRKRKRFDLFDDEAEEADGAESSSGSEPEEEIPQLVNIKINRKVAAISGKKK